MTPPFSFRVPESAIRIPPSAILLLGPTGSGKTPLGECIEREGLWGRRCFHFDFGANLRQIAVGAVPAADLTPNDRRIVDRVLKTGALLEEREFPIARRVLQTFLDARGVEAGDMILLNGLPRHAGQADKIEDLLRVGLVVFLSCTARAVYDRVRLNSGGDREGRLDDSPADIERKLRIFEERTLPLLDHYRRRGVAVQEVPVDVDTGAETIRQRLNCLACPF